MIFLPKLDCMQDRPVAHRYKNLRRHRRILPDSFSGLVKSVRSRSLHPPSPVGLSLATARLQPSFTLPIRSASASLQTHSYARIGCTNSVVISLEQALFTCSVRNRVLPGRNRGLATTADCLAL